MKDKIYKLKKPLKTFYCALCGVKREMKFKRKLGPKNYAQIAITCALFTGILFPLMSFKVLFFLPFVWLGTEFTMKLLYRKELNCPHCGFDPVWYCKDVSVAKNKVEGFWAEQEPSEQAEVADIA